MNKTVFCCKRITKLPTTLTIVCTPLLDVVSELFRGLLLQVERVYSLVINTANKSKKTDKGDCV